MSELADLQLEVVSDYDAVSRRLAGRILDRLVEKPSSSLLVPTGTTPEGAYAILSKESPDKFAGVRLFNYDEYCFSDGNGGYSLIDPEDPRSYRAFMQKHLLGALPAIESYFPGLENATQPGHYDAVIAAKGGIDLCVSPVGEDGHTCGFNFPGTRFDSISRLVEVNEHTKNVNAELTGHDIPPYAATAGIRTGMQAKEIVVPVSGLRKAEILRRILLGDISEKVPATVLRTHFNCMWIVDEAAASYLPI